MVEYIEREVAVRIAENYGLANGTSIGRHSGIADIIGSAIEFLPAADVAPVKHGKWHILDNCSNEGVYCSVCQKKVYRKSYANQKVKSNFCPNCGAKMDLEEGK